MQTVLISMLEKWKLPIYNRGFAGGVLMDLTKAFDTINHQLLLAKLHAYGFSKQALARVCSYLSNWKQRIKINVFSSWKDLILGVPRGSVLGLLEWFILLPKRCRHMQFCWQYHYIYFWWKLRECSEITWEKLYACYMLVWR